MYVRTQWKSATLKILKNLKPTVMKHVSHFICHLLICLFIRIHLFIYSMSICQSSDMANTVLVTKINKENLFLSKYKT